MSNRARFSAMFLFGSAAVLAIGSHLNAQEKEVPVPSEAEQLYQAKCSGCHAPNRDGGSFGPPVQGAAFEAKWRKAGWESLQSYIAENMPPSDPGSLSSEQAKSLAGMLLVARGGANQSNEGSARSGGAALTKGGPTDDYNPSKEPFDILAATPNTDVVYHTAMKARQDKLKAMANVSEEMLKNPPAADWLAARRTYDAAGFSPLTSINKKTARNLQVAWSLALPTGTNGITPLAHDGVLFVNSSGTVLALDAISGDVLWRFNRRADGEVQQGPPVSQPRGMAIFGEALFVPTIDNHVIALDIRTGKQIWDAELAPKGSNLRISAPPIIVRGKVIQGLAGCEASNACALVALDVSTGKEVWRVRTIAKAGTRDGDTWGGQPDEKRLGGSIWAPASYDPDTNLIYIGVSQTYHVTPLLEGGKRGLNNSALYTDSTLAIDPDTGKLKWHYQHMQRDVWDLDWAFERLIMTLSGKSGSRKVVATMGKVGILDVLDARSGRYLFSYDLGYQNLIVKIDPKTGKKYTDPALEPEAKAKTMCPYAVGVRNWSFTSLDPRTNTLFIPYLRTCEHFALHSGREIDISWNYTPPPGEDRSGGGVAALDVHRRDLNWKSKTRAPSLSGMLATEGGVVFSGGGDRYFRVQDSSNGELLWELRLDQIPAAAPITFEAGGDQYVAITTGSGSPLEAVTRPIMPENDRAGPGVRLWMFKLRSEGSRQ